MIGKLDLQLEERQSRLALDTATILRWTSIALMVTVWLSSAIFGLYILAFYAGAFYTGELEQWNGVLPRLYEPDSPLATTSIGLHFAAGGLILALGFIQLISSVRQRAPGLHRWVGRVYVSAALLAGLGGFIFIVVKGTIGGTPMNIGFGLYGLLMLVAGVQTWRYARKRRLEVHRAWAIRLFALAIGSWLYRMDYGFWLLLTGGLGHRRTFDGPFDIVMAFFFYLPNLLVAETFIRAHRFDAHPVFRLTAAAMMAAAIGFLLIGTYYFTRFYWGPAILARLLG